MTAAQEATPLAQAYNLRRAIRHELESSDETNPDLVADAVMKGVPRRLYARLLRELLRRAVVEEMGNQRREAMSATPATKAQGSRFHRWKSGQDDRWLRAMRAPIETGDSTFKALRDCTADDLQYAAERRFDLARANNAQARKFMAYREAVLEHEVATFGDLPAEARLRLLGGAE